MKKLGILLFLIGSFLFVSNLPVTIFKSFKTGIQNPVVVAQYSGNGGSVESVPERTYNYPEFYRGIYLNVATANNLKKLRELIEKSKSANINAMVLDVQSAKYVKCMVPESHIRLCRENGIHPIARIVVFPDGLKKFPVPDSYLEDRLAIAEDACKNGFREIQFDYIRFYDSGSTKKLTYAERYKYIEDFLIRARNRIKKYNARLAADVFGRIPLNTDDIIGQKIESLDKVVDMICPMAYPSHYTWSKKFYKDPYFTVHETSTRAKSRSKNAMIVAYIQAFKMKMSGIPFETYLSDQIKAVHDSGIKGYIMWNARQEYDVPLAIAKEFYQNQNKKISKKHKTEPALVD